MSDTTFCPECGSGLSPDAPKGLCPRLPAECGTRRHREQRGAGGFDERRTDGDAACPLRIA